MIASIDLEAKVSHGMSIGPGSALQLNIAPLAGRFIVLEPYTESLRHEVREALDCDPEAWNLFSFSGQGPHFTSWWQRLTDAMARGDWIAYTVRDRADERVVGTTSFLNIKRERQCVEIGATFYSPRARSTYVNPEAKLLMLSHAFSSGARRVELLTDARNARSRAAIAKLGAVREGILRRDRITWTGHIRDSVLYSVTDLDWPEVRARLSERVASFERRGS
jgi:RimJ/RimL family protein N-acetyltransferase